MSVHTKVQHNPRPSLASDIVNIPRMCPICGAAVEATRIGDKLGWTCLTGGYTHYYQARYGHLERWFTSGEGNLREPLINAMNCAA